MRIGLISDTHMPGSIRELWRQVCDAFDGVDCILHGGDLYTRGVIDQLNELAPVYVARGNGDLEVSDERLEDTWVLDFDGVKVSMIHEFPSPRRRDADYVHRYMEKTFGDDADAAVLVYGHTHCDEIHQVNGLLCVNPGSPTLPRNMSLRLGTIGFLDIEDGAATATLYQLTDSGIVHIDF